ncbi:Arc family DNA-binding protein [Tropicimonas aquimaris]|uniref:Arc family DNA-binding protein n=1 Tax=Tropicimonas aquimaris TaxID=914152 RepID=A0ABW3IIX2_9RHOB
MTRRPLQLRLPPELKDWIAHQAQRNNASQNSEIVRAVRERMERTERELTRMEASQ